MKTVRLRLKTGEFILAKDVLEFLVGRNFFVLILESQGAKAYPTNNILSVDYLTKGSFFPIIFKKKVKSK